MSHGDSRLASLSALRDVIAHADAIAMGADPVGPRVAPARVRKDGGARAQQESALPLMLQGIHGQQAYTHEQQAFTHEQQALAARHQLAFQDEAQAEAFFDHAVRALQCGSPAVDSQIDALERDLLSRSNTLSAEQLQQGSKAQALAEQCAALESRLEDQLRLQPPGPGSACGEPGGLPHSLGASAPPWRREKAALHQQVGELQAQLTAAVRSNKALVQHLAELGPSADLSLGAAATAATSRGGSGGGGGGGDAQALRRRRAVEQASADERRKVELRAARGEASRALQNEQRHAAALHRQLHLGEAQHRVSLAALRAALGESDVERRAAAEAHQARLAQVEAEAESQLQFHEELCRMRVQAAERSAAQAQRQAVGEARAAEWTREKGIRQEQELRTSLAEAAGRLGDHQKQAQASQAAMQLLHTELEVVQATLPQPRASEVLVDSLDMQAEPHGMTCTCTCCACTSTCTMRHAPCPMPYALCPMPYAPCTMHAPCSMACRGTRHGIRSRPHMAGGGPAGRGEAAPLAPSRHRRAAAAHAATDAGAGAACAAATAAAAASVQDAGAYARHRAPLGLVCRGQRRWARERRRRRRAVHGSGGHVSGAARGRGAHAEIPRRARAPPRARGGQCGGRCAPSRLGEVGGGSGRDARARRA